MAAGGALYAGAGNRTAVVAVRGGCADPALGLWKFGFEDGPQSAPITRDSPRLWRWARQFPKGLDVLLAAGATVGGAGSQKTNSLYIALQARS